ncbi:MAG: efflux RND transporter permease subunit, partial [Phycisphaerae bacterium]|nr:efflux RND transporter permease subunit [Phycisphaerae bacterium]
MLLSNVAIRNRTTVFVAIFLVLVTGVYSYVTLPRESAPEVKLPNVLITTPHEGVTPRDVENTVTNKIEQEITGVKGLDEVRSVTSEGLSQINVEFQTDVDIDDALQRIKDKVDLAKPELPSNSDKPVEPVIAEINIAEFPIMIISLSGPISPVRLKLIAEALEDEIEVLPGVLEVDVSGTLEREILVEIDPDRLAQYNLTTEELLRIVPSQHVSQSAGGLETKGTKFNIRIPMEVTQPDEIDKFPLAVRDGKQIYLSDVAQVRDTFKDRQTYSRLDGQPGVTLAVKKRVGANIVEIAAMIKVILDEARKRLPPGVKLELTDDRSKEIHSMILDLENNILTGLILVVGVLMIFMGLRSSLIVAVVIPLSMLMSFAAILAMGYTLNMVVLFALILALGMLVDNAIVIVENIYRFMEMGYTRVEAAMKGTAEVAWPVIASTATTVAAFVPLLFWPGIMGEFMRFVPITVITVLSSSLIVAMMVNPVICSMFARPGKRKLDPHHQPGRFVRGYRHVLETALRHPGTTLLLSVLLLAAVIVVYTRRGRGTELFPSTDPDQGVISIRAPQGTHLDETDRITRIVEERVEAFRFGPEGQPRIKNIVTTTGAGGGNPFDGGDG